MIMNFAHYFFKIEFQFSSALLKIGYSLLKKSGFSVIFKMFEMCNNCVFSLVFHLLHYTGFIIWFSFPGLDSYSSLRAITYAGTKAVAHKFAYQPYLTIYNLQRTFMTVWNTLATTVAKFLINFQNIPFHIGRIYEFSSAKLKK